MRKLKENWFNDLKVGDEVIINERIGDTYAYPYGFVDEMDELSGSIFSITEIYTNFNGDCLDLEFSNGDTSDYCLSNGRFSWHSSMFSPVDSRFYEDDSSTLEISIPEIKITL